MQDNILWFDVSVDDFEGVNLINSLADLFDIAGYLLLWHRLVFFELVIELSTCSDFQDDVNIGLIIEVSVHFNYVRMVEIHLYFKLSDKLLDNLLLFQKLFLDHFHCAHEPCRFLSKTS